jgi:hypothetical protein
MELALRRLIVERAGQRCEYCLLQADGGVHISTYFCLLPSVGARDFQHDW